MDLTHLRFAVEDGLATITLNRPESRNALSEDMRRDFDQVLAHIKPRLGDEVKAVLITGAGHSFCAGGDVKAMASPERKDLVKSRARMRSSHERLFNILNLECPVVAAVNGHAAGAGFGLALMADFVFAGPSTRFACSFGRIGLMPDWGLIYTLPRAVGMQKAKDLIFTGRRVRPAEAQALGLVHTVVDDDAELVPAATAFARRFCNASTAAIGLSKVILNKSFEASHREVLEAEGFGQPHLAQTPFHQEAVRRFGAKETPQFDWEQLERDAAE